MDRRFASRYWICDLCATAKKWTLFREQPSSTVDKCAWCKTDKRVTMFSVKDYKNESGRIAAYEPIKD